ncbi:hypothetical protein GCM10027348_42560 [Hymenobacter tenuis]
MSGGLPNGEGTVEYNNGTKVTGQFVNGVLNDDDAKYQIPQIGNIEGVVVSGQLNSGRIRYNNGDVYTGEIRSYSPDGNGVFIKSNNDVYEGKFQIGKFLSGNFLESKTQSVFQGSFKNWKPDGEVVEIELNGKASSHLYSNGKNQTESILEDRAKSNLKRQNEAELNKIDAEERLLSKHKEEQASVFAKEKATLEEEGGEMYDRCACTLHLKLCLGVYSAGKEESYAYSTYYEEFNLPEPYGPVYGNIYSVTVPTGSSKSVIKQAFLNKIAFVSECVKWNEDRDTYERVYKDKLTNLITSHQQFLQSVEAGIIENKRQKELAYQRQESERQARHEAAVNEMKKEMNDRAQKAAKERAEYCAKNPECCLSQENIERLKAEKKYTPCATRQ